MQQMMQQMMRWANALFVRKRDLMGMGLSLLSTGLYNVGIGIADAAEALAVGGRIYQDATLGDRLSLYGNRFDQESMYGFGVETGTLYYKSNDRHRWYVKTNADGGTSHVMQLNESGTLQLGRQGAEAVIVTTHPGNGSNQTIARIYQPSANTALMALIDLVMTKETSGGYAVKVEQHVMSVRVNASGNGTPAVTKTHNGTASSVNAGFYTIGDGTISGVVTEANNVDIRLAVAGSGNAVDHAIRVVARIRALSTNGQITNILGL